MRGKSGEGVAAALKWSPSKLSRYERARTGLRPREVERLLDYYQITGPRREYLLGLARDAAMKGWWEEFSDTLPEDYQEFIGLEHEAASMLIWQTDVVPGLLQTETYAQHIISSYGRIEPAAPAMLGRMVRVRMQRQQALDRPGIRLAVVLDESVLYRQIGDEAAMRDQLIRLAREAGRSGVTLQVLPLRARRTVFGSSYVIFGFSATGGDADPMLGSIVSVEHQRTGLILDDEREAYLHELSFAVTSGEALDPQASRDLIIRVAQSQWGMTKDGVPAVDALRG